MDTQLVYLGHDNEIRLQLKASSSAVSLASVTKMTLTLASITIVDSSASAGYIKWQGASYSTGEVRLDLGNYSSASTTLPAGKYDAALVVYDATYTSGVVWDKVPIRVYSEVEN